MTKITSAKCKLCRREGEKLMLRGERCSSPKCALIKRNYPPGAHGAKGKVRLTPYGQQLREKQKAKKIYGIAEKQFSKYYRSAIKSKGDTSHKLFQLLENRLDNVIYRLGWAPSRTAARQLVSHNHFQINGKKVNIPSYQVKIGDVIKIKEKSLAQVKFQDLKKTLANEEIVSWLSREGENLTGKVLSDPKLEESKQPIDWTTIIEFYSR